MPQVSERAVCDVASVAQGASALLAVATGDGHVAVFQTSDGCSLAEHAKFESNIGSFCTSLESRNKLILAGFSDGSVQAFDTEAKSIIFSIAGQQQSAVSSSPTRPI